MHFLIQRIQAKRPRIKNREDPASNKSPPWYEYPSQILHPSISSSIFIVKGQRLENEENKMPNTQLLDRNLWQLGDRSSIMAYFPFNIRSYSTVRRTPPSQWLVLLRAKLLIHTVIFLKPFPDFLP